MHEDVRTCVITVNYDGAEDTASCVESLLKSVVRLSIVVVDNTPYDPGLELALSRFPEVTVLRSPENVGFGRGNNLGIAWAIENTECEFFFIFNNDATIDPVSVQKLYEVMDERTDVGIATGRVVASFDDSVLWYGGGDVDWRRGGGRVPGFMGSSTTRLALESREVGFVSGCAMLIRRSVIEEIGGFDPLFFMYEEDLDLSLRVRAAGYKLYYLSTALFYHRIQGSQRAAGAGPVGKWSPKNPNYQFHVFHMMRNSIINMRKHMRSRNFVDCVLIFPVVTVVKVVKASWVMGWPAIPPVWRGLYSGLTASLKDKNRCHEITGGVEK